MRGPFAVLVSVLVAVGMAGDLRAGVYLPVEEGALVPPLGNFEFLRKNLVPTLRYLAFPATAEVQQMTPEGQTQLRYQHGLRQLEEKERQGSLTSADRINLSGYYLRLMTVASPDWAERAIHVLEEAPETERDSFVLANLASAYQLSSRDRANGLERARDSLRKALRIWPAHYPGFTRKDLNWFRRAEQYHLKLLEERYREALRVDPRRPPEMKTEVLDALFPVLARAGRGEYGVGPLEPEANLELPTDSYMITAQLVLWFPYDDRLFWLLGEVVNALEGNAGAATAVFEELTGATSTKVPRRYGPDLLRRHLPVLREVAKYQRAWDEEPRRVLEQQLLNSLTPLKGALPLGVAPMLEAAAWGKAFGTVVQDPGKPVIGPSTGSPPSSEEPPRKGPMVDWRQLGVGFAVGAVVAFLIGAQFQMVRRRRLHIADSSAARLTASHPAGEPDPRIIRRG